MNKTYDCKLGKIKNGKLIKFDKKMVWNFDKTLAIFISAGLRTLKENGDKGIPYELYDKARNSYPNITDDEAHDKALAEWWQIVDDIIDGFDAYITIGSVIDDEEVKLLLKKYKKALKLFVKWFGEFWD